MLQRVLGAYQRFVKSARNSAGARLEVLTLEERCTPTAAEALPPVIHPPETVLVGSMTSAFAAPTNQATMVVAAAVRTDLFGAGEGHPEETPEGDDCFAGSDVPHEFARPHHQETDEPAPVSDANDADIAVSPEDLILHREE